MSIELKIPDVGESVREVQIARWLKQEGDTVEQDEDLVELDTDKASMDLPAPAAGRLAQIVKGDGETVSVGEVIGYLEQNGKPAADGQAAGQETAAKTESKPASQSKPTDEEPEPPAAADEPSRDKEKTSRDLQAESSRSLPATPSARRAMREHGLTAADVKASGPRITQGDVLSSIDQGDAQPAPRVPESSSRTPDSSLEETVPMSLIRRRIAERLVAAQHQAALLTTFNEIDMSAVKALRAEHRERFEKAYDVKLGFMSFFVKAAVDALRRHPEINAEIRDGKIVYRNYQHIGVAIGGERGLVVPVLRYAERLSFAEIERSIGDFATRAAAKKLSPDEFEGGTFTITNGGVFGSLLSTPIVNPPQSGVLGMHAIEDRPVARDGQVVIRPMMYVALTYDHRLVDGRDAVTFLKRIKETIEDPARMLLEV